MIQDYNDKFSNSQELNGSAISTNILDFGTISSRIQALVEKGQAEIFVNVEEVFNTLTSLKIEFRTCANVDCTTDDVELASLTVLAADLTDGATFRIKLPAGKYARYNALYYTVGGSNPSTGIVSAALVIDGQTNGL